MAKKLLEESTVKRLQEMAGINEGYYDRGKYDKKVFLYNTSYKKPRYKEPPKEKPYETAKKKLAFMNKKGYTEVGEFAKQHAESVGIPLDDTLFEAMFSLSVAYENALSSIDYMQDLARLKGKSLEDLGITDEYMKSSIEEAYNMAKAESDAGKERDDVRDSIMRSFTVKLDEKVKQAL